FFHTSMPPKRSTLSLHDALPILAQTGGAALDGICDASGLRPMRCAGRRLAGGAWGAGVRAALSSRGLTRRDSRGGRSARHAAALDRKSTRLNSSHVKISYAVFCL